MVSAMFLLPPFLKQFLYKLRKEDPPRLYLRDEQLVLSVRKLADDQQRLEQEIYDDLLHAGMRALQEEDQYAALWLALSEREQQVTALTCLGLRSYEIADLLGISYDTVRTHSKHIYAKF